MHQIDYNCLEYHIAQTFSELCNIALVAALSDLDHSPHQGNTKERVLVRGSPVWRRMPSFGDRRDDCST